MPALRMMLGSLVSVVLLAPMMMLMFHPCRGSMIHVGQRRCAEQAGCDEQQQNSFHRLVTVPLRK